MLFFLLIVVLYHFDENNNNKKIDRSQNKSAGECRIEKIKRKNNQVKKSIWLLAKKINNGTKMLDITIN